MSDEDELRRAMKWFAGRDTGMSSKAIAAAMCGVPSDGSIPHDPADLGRCLRLLELFPEWKGERFKRTMSGVSHQWSVFVESWDKMAESMADEVGIGWTKGRSAKRTYDIMRAALDRAILTDPGIKVTATGADGSPRAWESVTPSSRSEGRAHG